MKSCNFPGCRKDDKCELCVASTNAILDLNSERRSSMSSITASSPQTPALCLWDKSVAGGSPAPLDSIAKSRAPPRKSPRYWTVFPLLILAAVCGFAVMKTRILTPEIVQTAGEQAKCAGDLRQKLVSVEIYLAAILGADRVSNCSGGCGWEFQQDGHLLNSKCVIFTSATEEVSVWGFPVPISRVISTGFSSRWLTVLSGRLTEWSRESLGFGEPRASAHYGRWETAVVHLEEATWVLEYRASSWLESWNDVIPRLGELL